MTGSGGSPAAPSATRVQRAVIFLALFAVSPSAFCLHAPQVVRGRIDLAGWSFAANGAVALKGQWQLFPERLADDYLGQYHEAAQVPGSWIGLPDGRGRALGNRGYAVYRLLLTGLNPSRPLALRLQEANTSYRAYLLPRSSDGHLPEHAAALIGSGVVGRSASETIPEYRPRSAVFRPTSTEMYLVIEVANFDTDKGGLSYAPTLLAPEQASRDQFFSNALTFLSIGVILCMGGYYLLFFIVRGRERSALLFALFCAGVAIRLVLTDRILPAWFFPRPSRELFSLTTKAEFLTVYLLLPTFYQFLAELYPRELFKPLIPALWAVAGVYVLGTAATDHIFYVRFILYYQLLILVVGLYAVSGIVRATIARRAGAIFGLFGFIVFFATIVHDVLVSNGIITAQFLLPYGFLAFIVSQMILLSLNFDHALRFAERFNQSLTRFVPREFIHFLGKESILEVKLGDSVVREMTVLFADIRSFTALAQTMSPDQCLRFLNSYLGRVAPIVRSSHGFIDTYIGDGIMALFPEAPQDAVACGIQMLDAVELYNTHRARSGYVPIRIGIGIHNGPLVLGTIGDEQRLDGTVIADAVNICARLEELNKTFGSSFIVSEQIIAACDGRLDFLRRMLGEIEVRGRRGSLVIYEVLVPNVTPTIELKERTKETFEQGVRMFGSRRYFEAGRLFHEVMKVDLSDEAARYYLSRCEELMRLGPADL